MGTPTLLDNSYSNITYVMKTQCNLEMHYSIRSQNHNVESAMTWYNPLNLLTEVVKRGKQSTNLHFTSATM